MNSPLRFDPLYWLGASLIWLCGLLLYVLLVAPIKGAIRAGEWWSDYWGF